MLSRSAAVALSPKPELAMSPAPTNTGSLEGSLDGGGVGGGLGEVLVVITTWGASAPLFREL
ncbi:MAG TPA: hypothetical protein VF734_03845 [Pseudonocardiaceae bacterium]